MLIPAQHLPAQVCRPVREIGQMLIEVDPDVRRRLRELRNIGVVDDC